MFIRKERIRLLRTLEIFNRDPDCEYTIEVNQEILMMSF